MALRLLPVQRSSRVPATAMMRSVRVLAYERKLEPMDTGGRAVAVSVTPEILFQTSSLVPQATRPSPCHDSNIVCVGACQGQIFDGFLCLVHVSVLFLRCHSATAGDMRLHGVAWCVPRFQHLVATFAVKGIHKRTRDYRAYARYLTKLNLNLIYKLNLI